MSLSKREIYDISKSLFLDNYRYPLAFSEILDKLVITQDRETVLMAAIDVFIESRNMDLYHLISTHVNSNILNKRIDSHQDLDINKGIRESFTRFKRNLKIQQVISE
jgi:hypothetical protein